MRDWLELSKPRITLMVALCSAAGYALAPGHAGWAGLVWSTLGVALASASTGCLNQVMEAGPDGLMSRTQGRPVPSGRVPLGSALALGLLWGAAGLALLAWKVNAASCALTAFTLASYLLIYTPMKRVSPVSTWLGAVPGAMPPVIGWAAAGGALDAGAAALFALQFFWQIPHFLALAWLHREDYARGGFKIYPVLDPSGASTAWQMAAAAGLLLALSALPFALGLAGRVYLLCAAAASLAFFAASVGAALELSRAAARRVFLVSLAYLPLVLAFLVFDRAR